MNTQHEIVKRLMKYMSSEMVDRLMRIRDPRLHEWLLEMIELLKPSRVYVIVGDTKDYEYIRRRALENREELRTRYSKHTVHFDGPHDLARDRKNTKILVPPGVKIPYINTLERERGLREIYEIMDGMMRGRELFIGFYCFGPKRSPFTMHAVQLTDSAYVAHNENLLYRVCYDEFVEKSPRLEYARFVHATGRLDENGWVVDIDKRRVYLDLETYTAYSTNTQYGGNTIGLKKIMFRFCIHKGYREGWLCEHMFIVGVRGPGDRITYITGAYPAGCGKTSTAFIADTIVGDDLAIIKPYNGEARAVNPEIGMFGIIDGVNPEDDPLLYKALNDPENEIIFSNVLLQEDGEVWWNGKPVDPKPGINYAGKWWPGKKDSEGNEIRPSHPNARFTIMLKTIEMADPRMDDPHGVPIRAMVFGGRDPDTWVPVQESFDWSHGVVTKGAALESQRTFAVLGQAGKREFNPFAILDFLSVDLGEFIKLHFEFEERVDVVPRIYGVNYFLVDEHGRFLNSKVDKRIWIKWIELRVHDEVDAIETPTGYIPVYNDLVDLFKRELDREYREEDYEKQFMIRAGKLLEKTERIWKIYESIPSTPKKFFDIMRSEKERLKETIHKYGEYVSPFKFDRR